MNYLETNFKNGIVRHPVLSTPNSLADLAGAWVHNGWLQPMMDPEVVDDPVNVDVVEVVPARVPSQSTWYVDKDSELVLTEKGLWLRTTNEMDALRTHTEEDVTHYRAWWAPGQALIAANFLPKFATDDRWESVWYVRYPELSDEDVYQGARPALLLRGARVEREYDIDYVKIDGGHLTTPLNPPGKHAWYMVGGEFDAGSVLHEFWIKIQKKSYRQVIISFITDWTTNTKGYLLYLGSDGKLRVVYKNSASEIETQTVDRDIGDNNWHHVAFAFRPAGYDGVVWIDGTRYNLEFSFAPTFGGTSDPNDYPSKPRALRIGAAHAPISDSGPSEFGFGQYTVYVTPNISIDPDAIGSMIVRHYNEERPWYTSRQASTVYFPIATNAFAANGELITSFAAKRRTGIHVTKTGDNFWVLGVPESGGAKPIVWRRAIVHGEVKLNYYEPSGVWSAALYHKRMRLWMDGDDVLIKPGDVLYVKKDDSWLDGVSIKSIDVFGYHTYSSQPPPLPEVFSSLGLFQGVPGITTSGGRYQACIVRISDVGIPNANRCYAWVPNESGQWPGGKTVTYWWRYASTTTAHVGGLSPAYTVTSQQGYCIRVTGWEQQPANPATDLVQIIRQVDGGQLSVIATLTRDQVYQHPNSRGVTYSREGFPVSYKDVGTGV